MAKCDWDKIFCGRHIANEAALNQTIAERDSALVQKQTEVDAANATIQALTQQSGDCGTNLAAALDKLGKTRVQLDLLVKGPPPPDPKYIRWMPAGYIDEVMIRMAGQKWVTATKEVSDSDYIICDYQDMARYLNFFKDTWLPIIKPYIVLSWTKLDGTKIDIYGRDCDDFADCLQGLPSLHKDWTPYPWGTIWGKVHAPLSTGGGHAFNFFLCWIRVNTPAYDETSSAPIQAFYLEPQLGLPWYVESDMGKAEVAKVVAINAKPLVGPDAIFWVDEIWFAKV